MDETGAILEWKGFDPTTGTAFQNLYADQDFTDVTLACEDDARLEAHKVILSSCSDFFSKILRRNPNPHPLIFLQGVSIKDLELLKRFMYLGSTRVNFDQMDNFMEVSKRFLNQPSEKDPPKPVKSVKQEKFDNVLETENLAGKLRTEKKEERIGQQENKTDVPSQTYQSSIKSTVLMELSNVLGEVELLTCQQCDFKCESRKSLKRHMYVKHANIACTEAGCGKILKNRGIWKEHVKNKHVGLTRQYLCDECDYSSKWFSCLQIHKRRHTGNLIQCPHCEYMCPKNNMLVMHLESKHNAAEYNCDQCDTKTRTRRMLKFHKEKVHEGMRYFCELCSHQATNSYNLRTHKRRCHDKIEINCTFCKFKDFEKSRVLLHERKKHSMEASEA